MNEHSRLVKRSLDVSAISSPSVQLVAILLACVRTDYWWIQLKHETSVLTIASMLTTVSIPNTREK